MELDTGRRRSRRGRLKTSGNNRTVTAVAETLPKDLFEIFRDKPEKHDEIVAINFSPEDQMVFEMAIRSEDERYV